MSEHPQATGRGFLMNSREWRIVGMATLLMTINVALMYAFVLTPLAVVNDYLFAAPIVGVLVYGAALMLGEIIAEKGVKNGSMGTALAGVALLQLAFGTLGAGILSFVPRDVQVTALGIAGVITVLITFLIATYVYARSKSFDRWSTYANGAFILGVIGVGVGMLIPVVSLVGFVFIFLGFLLRLGWEIWRIRERRGTSEFLSAIGVYIAIAGVFVHVLQLVLRFMGRD